MTDDESVNTHSRTRRQKRARTVMRQLKTRPLRATLILRLASDATSHRSRSLESRLAQVGETRPEDEFARGSARATADESRSPPWPCARGHAAREPRASRTQHLHDKDALGPARIFEPVTAFESRQRQSGAVRAADSGRVNPVSTKSGHVQRTRRVAKSVTFLRYINNLGQRKAR